MSSENGDPLSQQSPVEESGNSQPREKRISYTRDFLLSLSELDVCKKLPIGFTGLDELCIRKHEDGYNDIADRQRSLGGSSLQNSRRIDYGSVPPSNNYSRASGGRWDTRSSGSNDRDGESLSERDVQDSGRRNGNHPHRSSQHLEHDGLLGSGAFPRPSGFVAAALPKGRGNGHYQLNRSNEPYQPPKTYKAVQYPRKDNSDSINDETFGSAECASDDRVEVERKRRALFESSRKEQQKSFQDKQKQNLDSHKGLLNEDVMSLLGKSDAEKNTSKEGKLDLSSAPPLLQNGSSKFRSHAQLHTSRPLVPPGFAGAKLEKNVQAPTLVEDGIGVMEHSVPVDIELSRIDKRTAGLVSLKDSVGSEGMGNMKFCLEEDIESLGGKLNGLPNNESRSTVTETVGHDPSTSILEKLFGGTLPDDMGGSLNFVEHEGFKAEEGPQSEFVAASSRFAHLFLEEEKPPIEDFSSRNLLSLIASNDRVPSWPSKVSDDKAIGSPFMACQNNQSADIIPELLICPVSEKYHHPEKQDSSIALRCEDLEQFILAEAKESFAAASHGILETQAQFAVSCTEGPANVDDHASQHLLSLLQKGSAATELETFSITGRGFPVENSTSNDTVFGSNIGIADTVTNKNSDTDRGSDKTLSLEALFGAAFMTDLQSVGDPVSTQSGSSGRVSKSDVQPHGNSLSGEADGHAPFLSEYHSPTVINNVSSDIYSYNDEAISQKIPGSWAENTGLGINLPEEDSLITLGDSLEAIVPDLSSLRNLNGAESLIIEKRPDVHSEVLLRTILRGEHAGAPSVGRSRVIPNLHEPVQSDMYHRMNGRPSSQFQHMNAMKHSFPPLDHVNRNQNMKFMGSDGMQHELQHPFPPNLHHFTPYSIPRLDPHPHMLQHVPMPGNFQPQHQFRGIPRGMPLPHTMNNLSGYTAEMSSLHGYPLSHLQQANYGASGVGLSGSIGGGHTEALQRLIEMEFRAKQEQMLPAAAGHNPRIFGPELDMGFRYR